MSRFIGPLPVDPVLGTDARHQAQVRLEYQQKLEAGLLGSPMSPDTATAYLDSCDTQARAMVLNRAEQQLRGMGFSDDGVKKMLTGMGSLSDSIGTGVGRYGDSVETGRHALNGLAKADAELFSKFGGRLGAVGNIAQLVSAGIDWFDGGDTRNQDLGEAVGGVGGSMLGGAGAGAAVGSVGGPFTAAAAAIIGGLLGGFAGSDLGGDIGGLFDPQLPIARLAVGSDHRLRGRIRFGGHRVAVHVAPQDRPQDLRRERLPPSARPPARTEERGRVMVMACA